METLVLLAKVSRMQLPPKKSRWLERSVNLQADHGVMRPGPRGRTRRLQWATAEFSRGAPLLTGNLDEVSHKISCSFTFDVEVEIHLHKVRGGTF